MLRVVPGDGTSVMVVVTPVADTLSVMSVSVQLLAPTMFVVVNAKIKIANMFHQMLINK